MVTQKMNLLDYACDKALPASVVELLLRNGAADELIRLSSTCGPATPGSRRPVRMLDTDRWSAARYVVERIRHNNKSDRAERADDSSLVLFTLLIGHGDDGELVTSSAQLHILNVPTNLLTSHPPSRSPRRPRRPRRPSVTNANYKPLPTHLRKRLGSILESQVCNFTPSQTTDDLPTLAASSTAINKRHFTT